MLGEREGFHVFLSLKMSLEGMKTLHQTKKKKRNLKN
jgi:hypothetical protein